MSDNFELADHIRFNEQKIICTGGIVFIGDGNTGKTHTGLNLAYLDKEKETSPIIRELKKSINLEFNFCILRSQVHGYQLTASAQLFIMPGQKGKEQPGKGLAFEDACEMYSSVATTKKVITLILTYDLTDMNTFQQLEYWLNQAMEKNFIQKHTSIIILGTHLDAINHREVTNENITAGKEFVRNYLSNQLGIELLEDKIYSLEISNISGKGFSDLKSIISLSFLKAFNLDSFFEMETKA